MPKRNTAELRADFQANGRSRQKPNLSLAPS